MHVKNSFKSYENLDKRHRKLHPEKNELNKSNPVDYMFELMDRNANGSINLSE